MWLFFSTPAHQRGNTFTHALSMGLPERIFIALPIWGDFYIHTFLTWSLPTLLAPGNLQEGPFHSENAHLLLYTTASSRRQLEKASLFQELAALIPVQWNIFEVPDVMPHRFFKHRLMSACYADAVLLAREHQRGLMPLTADNLFSAGALTHIFSASKQADVVLLAGLRISYTAISALERYRQGKCLNIPASDLVGLALKYPHPHFRACFMDAPLFSAWPSQVYYRTGPASFQARCFHLHPIFISAPLPFTQVPEGASSHLNTLDGHYLQQYYAAGAQFKIVDGLELAAVTLSQEEDVPMVEKNLSFEQRQQHIKTFGRNYCLPVHHYFFEQLLTFQGRF